MDVQVELPTGFSTPKIADWDFLPGQWAAAGSLTVELGIPNIELDDLDLRFLDTYNTTVPFELGGIPQAEHTHTQQTMAEECHSPSAYRASEAFRNHHWRFRPNAKDHGAAEEHNLSLPSGAGGEPPLVQHATPAKLSASARDNILAVVIKECRPENTAKAVASFPSVSLLDTLIQFYLTSPIARADTFLHGPTFEPNEKKPELLLAMAAAGAVLTSDPTLTKLGYAMQECVRTAIPEIWERDNTKIRDLELAQAFLINLETGLWSGLSRKVEITESFLQPVVTMFRRGGRFKKSSYPTNPVARDSRPENSSHQTRWRDWIFHESWKRATLRLLRHDASSSMYVMVSPIMSYAELSLPLPCAPALWEAQNAEQWESLLSSPSQPSVQHPPTVTDYLVDAGSFATHISHFDVRLANGAFLACAWSLAWEYIQLSSLQRAKPGRWNAFLLSSRLEEILKLLDQFRISLDPNHTPRFSEVRMRLEIILLHLHTPFEDIQIFAGIEGPDQARAAYPTVLEWAKTETARKAICHAGQALRFAKSAPKSRLQGLFAVLIYQASLVLWVYALFSDEKSESAAPSNRPADAVWLDGDDELALQRFGHFGMGTPHLRGSTASPGGAVEVSSCSLRDPESLLGTVIGILRDNHEGLPKPHLVERLLQLMEALQRSSAGMIEFLSSCLGE